MIFSRQDSLKSSEIKGTQETQTAFSAHMVCRGAKQVCSEVRRSRPVVSQMAKVDVPRELFRSILQAMERLRQALAAGG